MRVAQPRMRGVRVRDRRPGLAARQRERGGAVVTVRARIAARHWRACGRAAYFSIFASVPLEDATCDVPLFPRVLCGNKIKMR